MLECELWNKPKHGTGGALSALNRLSIIESSHQLLAGDTVLIPTVWTGKCRT